ncbi:MBL fold metallo-hydrolase [Streptomyces sp. NPDC005263]|uniref:MBL fold metallo-hydrolase n=1 Tax=Streptomyces sp. NPDC005263 TaxID=3364711 RepID=UPI0036746BB6
MRPEDVDLVVNAHLHVDHVGWTTRLVDSAWVPTFPNTTYLMPRADFERWNPATHPDIAGSVNENVFEDSVAPVHPRLGGVAHLSASSAGRSVSSARRRSSFAASGSGKGRIAPNKASLARS